MPSVWRCRHVALPLGNRTLLMGVVNVTPDSFSDGGRFFQTTDAIRNACQLVEDGADLIDVGGASSRPGAEPVSEEEELRRVLPVVEELAGKQKQLVSVDTVSHTVAARCLEAGAAVINDISGLQSEPRLASLAAESGAGLVIMHMRGNPQSMQSLTHYEDIFSEIRIFFEKNLNRARASGVQEKQIVLDPGIGFSKTVEQNLVILQNLNRLRIQDFPLLLGVSRKSFIGKITGAPVQDRLIGTAAAVAVCAFQGMEILRVHDVKAMREAVHVAEAIRRGTLEP